MTEFTAPAPKPVSGRDPEPRCATHHRKVKSARRETLMSKAITAACNLVYRSGDAARQWDYERRVRKIMRRQNERAGKGQDDE